MVKMIFNKFVTKIRQKSCLVFCLLGREKEKEKRFIVVFEERKREKGKTKDLFTTLEHSRLSS